MDDVQLVLENEPGTLARMGEVLGAAGVSVEGGGCFAIEGKGIAHFLFNDGAAAMEALENAGIPVTYVREALLQRLDQEEPGQLGKICRMMAVAGVNILVQYSDHDNQLVLVVDDIDVGRRVSAAWQRGERL